MTLPKGVHPKWALKKTAPPAAEEPVASSDVEYAIGDNNVSVTGVDHLPEVLPDLDTDVVVDHPETGGKNLALWNKNHGVVKKKRRFRPGTKALRDIRKYQKSTGPVIKKAPFRRVCREIFYDMTGYHCLWEGKAFAALQEAAEAHIVKELEDAQHAAIAAGRVTILKSDMQLARAIRKAFSQ